MPQLPLRFLSGETGEQIDFPVVHSALLECGESVRRLLIEVTPWNFRVGVSFAREKPAHIASIFAEQGPSVVFRMALKENEQAVALLNEHIRAYIGRPRKDLIALRSEGHLGKLIVSGMREAPSSWSRVHDRMVYNPFAVENSGKLLPKWTTAYTIDMKDRGVCCKALPYRRNRV